MPGFDDATTARLTAVFDRIIPADDFPAVSDAGLLDHLDDLARHDDTAALVTMTLAVVEALDDRARADHGVGVAEVSTSVLDELIADLEWVDREVLVQRAADAYYGGAHTPGARMVGYDAAATRDPGAPVVEPPVVPTALDRVDDDYDALVIGAGAGGGVAAAVLADAGLRVLVVDRGAALAMDELGRDHLRNHRSSVLGNNTGPDAGEERVLAGPDGVEQVIGLPHDPRWHNNAMTVGGGTRVHQGIAWRFVPTDFEMATTYGVPEDSSLADWPLTYDDLEPHYAWAEDAIGVCGDAAAHPSDGPRSAPLPMPPLPADTAAEVLGAGAARLGLSTGPVPQAVNSVPRGGRARCVGCGECVGFACISGAKNGPFTTVLPRALASGRAALVTGVRATEVTVDASGAVDGVRLVDGSTGARRRVRAGHVVVACGAIETARLLLASRSRHHPDGLGNGADQVGRHLQGHVFVSAFGRFDDPVVDVVGPGSTIATGDHRHGNDPVIGGGVITNELLKLPIVHWRWSRHPDAPRWGLAAKDDMRSSYRRTAHLFGQVQEITRADNRVTLSDRVDALGVPVPRLAGRGHPETLRAATMLEDVAVGWMGASGALDVWTDTVPHGLTAGHHQAGTARMGTDPATSVTDATGRVHGHANLWVADAALHVTNGGVSPSLTIYALAHRVASTIARA